MSRGAEVAGPNHGAELQATLDPAAHPVPAPPSKGKGRATTTKTSGETSRRQSGASSILRKDVPVAAGGMALLGASDKDLRETTMVMGLQREEGTRSEVVLDRIWVWKPPG
jgi:anaphase-promoting complex subunit 1